ncbi:MAG TPA: DUF3570 domain-containing protein [Sandaracinaceae bacterium LLY-WYZ-13_1]|nr:DUF3570 domain-containing protein [Sandaracinaceae bacterium LLY-WYZ-13_1]
MLAALLSGWAGTAAANEGGGSLFVRGDSDETVVVAPRVAGNVVFNEERTRVDASYSADIWTSASIDIRTAATQPITEQRDQIDLSASHELDDVTIGGSYYYSGENDYWSHGFTLRSEQELFGGSTTFAESVRYVHDVVGRSGDPDFDRPLDSLTLRASLTQILSPEAIVQATWEGTYRNGYQASPYRFVGLGGFCGAMPDDLQEPTSVASFCVPESHPTERFRNAFVLRGRYAFSRDASGGLGYRLYLDDWGVSSHTAVAQIAWLPEPGHTVTLRYRFYTQTAAAFYRSTYEAREDITFVTRDRELSPMFSNRVALSYGGRAHLTEGVDLKVQVALGGSVFVYQDFVGLDEVFSLDGTIAATLEL